MSAEYHIAVSTNLRYLPGARTAVCSVAVNAAPASHLVFHVFTENVPCDAFDGVRNSVLRLHAQSRVIQHEVDDSVLADLPFWASSRMAAVRCKYAELLPDVDWCLYLDCDVLYLASPEEHFAKRDDGYAAVATQEQHVPTRKKECAWIRDNGYSGIDEEKYFNSGVMLLNLKRIRDEGLSAKLVDFFRCHQDVASPDQDALNSIFMGKVKIIEPKWNRLQIFLTNDAIRELPVIHFVSGIPWLPNFSVVANGRYRLWHLFNDLAVHDGETCSEKQLLPWSNRIAKRIEYLLLTGRCWWRLFGVALKLIGKGRHYATWRETQIGSDIDAESLRWIADVLRERLTRNKWHPPRAKAEGDESRS